MNDGKPKNIISKINPADKKIAIIVSRFNEQITSRLLEGALQVLEEHKMPGENIFVFHVPGAFEIPLAAKRLAEAKEYDAIICLGAVIRGETPHFDYVCNEASRGIMDVGLEYGLPVIFGVLTTDTVEQALARSDSNTGQNKGSHCAMDALEMISLLEEL